ncbi:hypothetical protein BS50DRAFT_567911 [Corynespora cassiicola Philippines]|uniref:Uncharacterized protein n=1 Tax=Corynespora cassiicola Philippines TaxID=1448308 RepID=A0A2T2PC11_CORCC|nr:hypothetical protein BS50DRAFT_567911 [Corynespora cassiicola Philippines]
MAEPPHGSSSFSDWPSPSLAVSASHDPLHCAHDAFDDDDWPLRKDSVTSAADHHAHVDGQSPLRTAGPLCFFPIPQYSACNAAGRAMCQFSRSITSKDISRPKPPQLRGTSVLCRLQPWSSSSSSSAAANLLGGASHGRHVFDAAFAGR